MRYSRCKCGKSWSLGSKPPHSCDRCPECKSDFAMGPTQHEEPKPHQLVTRTDKVDADIGPVTVTLTRCIWCLKTKAEIVDRNEPWEMKEKGSP